MRVTIVAQISGTRNGQPWPKPGESVDLPDPEAAQLCAIGAATEAGPPARAAGEPETATVEPPETATEEPRKAPAKKAPAKKARKRAAKRGKG